MFCSLLVSLPASLSTLVLKRDGERKREREQNTVFLSGVSLHCLLPVLQPHQQAPHPPLPRCATGARRVRGAPGHASHVKECSHKPGDASLSSSSSSSFKYVLHVSLKCAQHASHRTTRGWLGDEPGAALARTQGRRDVHARTPACSNAVARQTRVTRRQVGH